MLNILLLKIGKIQRAVFLWPDLWEQIIFTFLLLLNFCHNGDQRYNGVNSLYEKLLEKNGTVSFPIPLL